MLDIVPVKNILFASEMIGAVRGIDQRPGTILTTPSGISITTPNSQPMKNSKSLPATRCGYLAGWSWRTEMSQNVVVQISTESAGNSGKVLQDVV